MGKQVKLESGPMPKTMAALLNIGNSTHRYTAELHVPVHLDWGRCTWTVLLNHTSWITDSG